MDGQRVKYFPRFAIGRLTQVGVTGTGFNAVKSRTWQYKAGVTMLRGTHTFKTASTGAASPSALTRVLLFGIGATGTFTGGPNPQAAAASASYTLRPLECHVHPYCGFVFQDEWRAARKLTHTLGLRYSIEPPRTEFKDK